jgi:hypothetical protein
MLNIHDVIAVKDVMGVFDFSSTAHLLARGTPDFDLQRGEILDATSEIFLTKYLSGLGLQLSTGGKNVFTLASS